MKPFTEYIKEKKDKLSRKIIKKKLCTIIKLDWSMRGEKNE